MENTDAAIAKVGSLQPVGCAGQLSIQKDGQAQLPGQAVADRQRLVVGEVPVLPVQIDDGDDVQCSDAGMGAIVAAHVDPLQGDPGRREHGVGQLLRTPHQREHAPVVVGVGVHIEERGTRRGCDRAESREVASLRHVDDALEHAHQRR